MLHNVITAFIEFIRKMRPKGHRCFDYCWIRSMVVYLDQQVDPNSVIIPLDLHHYLAVAVKT